MKKSTLLLALLCFVSVVWLTACGGDDDDNDNGSDFGNVNTNVIAPASISGRSFVSTVNNGTLPFTNSGTFVFTAGGTPGSRQGDFTIQGQNGFPDSFGTFTFSRTSSTTSTLLLQDGVFGTVTMNMTFSSITTGTFLTTSSSGGTQSGNFTFTSIP